VQNNLRFTHVSKEKKAVENKNGIGKREKKWIS